MFEHGPDETVYRHLTCRPRPTTTRLERPRDPRGRARGARSPRPRGDRRRLSPAACQPPGPAEEDPRRTPRRLRTTASWRSSCSRTPSIASARVLPGCQDTGTAIVLGYKGQGVFTGGGDDAEALSRWDLREPMPSATCATPSWRRLSMYPGEEHRYQPAGADRDLRRSEGDELPFPLRRQGRRLGEQDLSLPGDQGAAEPGVAESWPSSREKMRSIGTSACPPYHLAHWSSAALQRRATLKTVKLASAKATSTTCRPRATSTAARSAISSSSSKMLTSPATRRGSAPSSAASTSPTTCG